MQWGGTAVLPLLTNTTQSVPEFGAGGAAVCRGGRFGRGGARKVCRHSALEQRADRGVHAAGWGGGLPGDEHCELVRGVNWVSGILQTTVTNSSGGYGQTWVHVPKGYYVVHAQMGVAANSTNLLNPTIDVGA